MLNSSKKDISKRVLSIDKIAQEMSLQMPRFVRYMYPYLYEAIDVPPSQVLTLITVEEEGSCNVTILSKRLQVSAPTMSGLIDRLVKRGYLKRIKDKKDRRVVNIHLTDSGLNIVKRFRKNILDRWKFILKNLSKEERMGPLIFINQVLEGITR